MIDLGLYREALLAHLDKCNHCMMGTSYCLTGRRLQAAYAEAAAANLAPIPTVLPRPDLKA